MSEIQNYNTHVSRSYTTLESKVGVNASRYCDLRPMGTSEARIVAWQKGKGYTNELFDAEQASPMKESYSIYGPRADGDGTIVTLLLEYTMKYGPLGTLMDCF